MRLTQEIHKSIVSFIKMGYPAIEACERNGVPYATFQKWMELASKDHETYLALKSDIEQAQKEVEIKIIESIREKAKGGDKGAQAELLDHGIGF